MKAKYRKEVSTMNNKTESIIEALEGEKIKLHDRSITLYNEHGKTKNVISGLDSTKTTRNRTKLDLIQSLKKCDLFRPHIMENIRFFNGEWVYFCDKTPFVAFHSMFDGIQDKENNSLYQTEKQHYDKRTAEVKALKNIMPVVVCEFVR